MFLDKCMSSIERRFDFIKKEMHNYLGNKFAGWQGTTTPLDLDKILSAIRSE